MQGDINTENRHIVYDIVNDYFHQWLNSVEALTEIAVNRPGELFVKVRGKWQQHQTNMTFGDCMSFGRTVTMMTRTSKALATPEIAVKTVKGK